MDVQAALPTRYSDRPFPPYAHLPGRTPHPVSDPRGHMYRQQHRATPPLQLAHWRDSPTYLYAVDLFNHGFHWEAHEAWESLWLAAGRTGAVALWLKTLIKLAAAMVKLREENAAGALRHARRAIELVGETIAAGGAAENEDTCGGIRLADVREIAALIIAHCEAGPLQADSVNPIQPRLVLGT